MLRDRMPPMRGGVFNTPRERCFQPDSAPPEPLWRPSIHEDDPFWIEDEWPDPWVTTEDDIADLVRGGADD